MRRVPRAAGSMRRGHAAGPAPEAGGQGGLADRLDGVAQAQGDGDGGAQHQGPYALRGLGGQDQQ
ncbi:hypothetical protein, partial [Streptomyces sp. E2N171]|uniref:hypothetical protein n=1 Tax=Streptomyces sp. E2N171 TaxID=1851914 RepID=UPI001EE92FAB